MTVVLAMVDTSGMPGFFFYATMISVIAINSEFLKFFKKVGFYHSFGDRH